MARRHVRGREPLAGLRPSLADAQAEPEPFTPAWYQREANHYAEAHGRTEDQLTNVAYQQLRAEVCTSDSADAGACADDPYRRLGAWDGVHGQVVDVSCSSRYGAVLRGEV